MVSKEKSLEGELEGLELVWVVEGGFGKESLVGGRGAGICWDLFVFRVFLVRSSVVRVLLGRSFGRSIGAFIAVRFFVSVLRFKNFA